MGKNTNPYAVLSDLPEAGPSDIHRQTHKAHQNPPRPASPTKEQANDSATSSPVLYSLAPSTPPLQARPILKHFPAEQKVVGNLNHPDDLAHQRTEQRLTDLMQATRNLNAWLQNDIFFDEKNTARLEYEVIKICEILLKLRENFTNWHYAKLIKDTLINGTAYSPIKMLRNMMVHEHLTLNEETRFERYSNLAHDLASLHDYQEGMKRTALGLNNYFDIEEYSQRPYQTCWKREYTPKIQSVLETLFNRIALEGKTAQIDLGRDHTQFNQEHTLLLVSIARAAEIIRQLQNKDPAIEIKIFDQPLDQGIIPYFMQVRKGVHHYNQGFQPSSVQEIINTVQSLKPSTINLRQK